MAFIKIVGIKVGRFLSDFSSVLITLSIYIILCLFTFGWIAWELRPNYTVASWISYNVATGGDPFIFREAFANHFWCWNWILAFRIVSWLIVPVLAGTAVSAAFISWEKEKLELEDQLNSTINNLIIKHLNVSADEAELITQQIQKDIKKNKIAIKNGLEE